MRLVREPDQPLPRQGRGRRGGQRQPGIRVGHGPLRPLATRRSRPIAAVEAAGYVARVEQAASADHEIDVAEAAAVRAERDEAAARHATDLRRRLTGPAILTIPLLARPGEDDRRPVAARAPGEPVGPARVGHAGAVLGRLDLLRGSVEGPAPQVHRHEHAHRGGHQRCLLLQRGHDPLPGVLHRGRPGDERRGPADVLRHIRGDHHAHPARPVPRGPGPQPHLGRDPPPDQPGPTHGARHPRRHRDRRAGRRGPGRATSSGCAQARRSPWTAWSPTACRASTRA